MPSDDSALADAVVRLGFLRRDEVDRIRASLAGRPLHDALAQDGKLAPAKLTIALNLSSLKAASTAPTPKNPAALRLGRFQIQSEIGRGGMGIVYVADDPLLGRPVALKVLNAMGRPSDADRKRFEQEARLAARLHHPAIAAVYDAAVEGGFPYIAMELIDGDSLASIFQQASADLRQRVEIIRRVAEAMHSAHAEGIIHRDLKPSNILVDAKGLPHIIDFGLARDVDAAAAITASGMSIGTPAYMSPEQARGLPLDAATDIYSLGVILYEAITLRRPFDGASLPEVMQHIVDDDPPLPREIARVDPSLEAVCMRAMAKDKARRYATAQELADDLSRWLAGDAVNASPPSTLQRIARSVRRHRIAAAVAATVTLTLAALAAFWWFMPGTFVFTLQPAGAELFVDDHPASSPVKLSPGRHQIRIRLDGFRTINESIEIGRGQTLERRFDMVRPSARLTIQTDPAGARVRLFGHGEPAEFTTPADVEPGRYVVEAWADGSRRVSETVELADLDDRVVTLNLPSAVLWKKRIGRINETPAIDDVNGDAVPDVVSPSQAGKLFALDGRSGDILWEVATGSKDHGDPVVLDDGTIAVGLETGEIIVVDRRGQFVFNWTSPGRPYLSSGRLFVLGSEGTLERVEDDRAVWTVKLNEPASAPPLLHGKRLLVATRAAFHVVDPETGDRRSRLPLDDEPTGPIETAGDVAYVGCRRGGVFAVDVESSKLLWKAKLVGTIRGRPAVHGGLVIVGDEGRTVAALDRRDGAPRWAFTGGSEFHASPVVGDVTGDGNPEVVIGNDDYKIYALDVETGRELWSFRCGEDVDSGPRLIDVDRDGILEVVACSNDAFVYALKPVK